MSTQDLTKVRRALSDLVGAKNVITDAEALKNQSLDWVGYRNYERYKGQFRATIPIAIVLPENEDQISKVLSMLNELGINTVPKTGKSGTTGGAEAGDSFTVVLDGSRLDQIIKLDSENMQLTALCGTPLEKIEREANKVGLTTGHFPQSLPMAQIGGLVATRSLGQFSTLYGGIENLVTGLRAVLPNGELIEVNDVPRRASGPDLKNLIIGSEGGLVYITQVTMKLFRYAPEERWLRAYAVRDMKTGLAILREIMVQGFTPAVARLHDYAESKVSYPNFVQEGEAVLLFIADGPKALTEATGSAIQEIAMSNGSRDLGTDPLTQWLIHRNDLCDHLIDNENLRNEIVAETCEIAANWSEINQIYEKVLIRLSNEVEGLVNASGHSSHSYVQGTNIYFMYTFKANPDPVLNEGKYFKVLAIIMEETLKLGGTIAHHHGIGKYRVRWVREEHGTAYKLMDIIKKAIDPKGIMNKGTLFA